MASSVPRFVRLPLALVRVYVFLGLIIVGSYTTYRQEYSLLVAISSVINVEPTGTEAATAAAAVPPATANIDTTATTTTANAIASICDVLPKDTSPLSLWTNHIGRIFNASRHPMDRQYHLHDDTAKVLRIITPRLPLSQRAFPRDWKTIDMLFKKVAQRLQYLQQYQKNPESFEAQSTKQGVVTPPPPIRILVVGGSVTMGTFCEIRQVKGYKGRNCAWPARLQHFINQMMNGQLVTVENVAMGGINTAIGKSLLEYDLLPDHITAPDIVINAHSTNDMHVGTIRQAASTGTTLWELVFDMAQDFCRVVLKKCMRLPTTSTSSNSSNNDTDYTRRPPPPLLLWLDDYLGNEQRQIRATTEASQSIQVLANYYGFGFVSYADTIRDLVYGTTTESVFSPDGWYKFKKRRMSREIHPGPGMHIATSYIIAYSLLQTASHYCSLQDWNVVQHERSLEYNSTTISGLPKLRNHKGNINDIFLPKPRPQGLPPRLHTNLSLETISADWQKATASGPTTSCGAPVAVGFKRCPFSWISGAKQWATDKKLTMNLFAPYWVQPSGWSFINDSEGRNPPKYGFYPKKSSSDNEVMTLNFDWENDHVVIHQVTIFYLKSYGAKWENSTAHVRVQPLLLTTQKSKNTKNSNTTNPPVVDFAVQTLIGWHNKTTSEMYQAKLTLTVPQSRGVRVQLEHESGKAFKLLGIAVCA